MRLNLEELERRDAPSGISRHTTLGPRGHHHPSLFQQEVRLAERTIAGEMKILAKDGQASQALQLLEGLAVSLGNLIVHPPTAPPTSPTSQ
jgi:hypothetical protein